MATGPTRQAAITPDGVRDGDPAVLAALAARRGPAVLAFAGHVCEPAWVVRAAADAFARFRAAVAAGEVQVHPDALLLGSARRAALDLAPRGPDLGCGPALNLLALRAEKAVEPGEAALLDRHLETCDFCHNLCESLEDADHAYREADDSPLDPSVLAPIVAALVAAAPVVATTPPAAGANGAPRTPEARTTRVPSYEIRSQPATGRRSRSLRKAAERATAASEAAVALTRRAGGAARRRLDRGPAPGPPAADPDEPAVDDTTVWQALRDADFDLAARTASGESELFVDPEIEAAAARAAARHHRRLRHRLQERSRSGRPGPPRLRRPLRERHHLPLSAHGPRDLALPAGLLVIAALVIMALAGVFGGGSSTPETGTLATVAAAPPPALQSATGMSLEQAVRIAATAAATRTTASP